MSKHRARPTSTALLRAAVALSAAGAALTAGAASASADELSDTVKLIGGPVMTGTTQSVRPITKLRIDPLAKTGVDPLTNGLSTQVADFKPIGTPAVTKPLTDGDSLSQLPVVGPATRLVAGH